MTVFPHLLSAVVSPLCRAESLSRSLVGDTGALNLGVELG